MNGMTPYSLEPGPYYRDADPNMTPGKGLVAEQWLGGFTAVFFPPLLARSVVPGLARKLVRQRKVGV